MEGQGGHGPLSTGPLGYPPEKGRTPLWRMGRVQNLPRFGFLGKMFFLKKENSQVQEQRKSYLVTS